MSPSGTSFPASLIFLQAEPERRSEIVEESSPSSSKTEGNSEGVKKGEPNAASYTGPIPAPFFTLTPSFLVSSAAARTFTYPILLDPTRGDESIDALLDAIEEHNLTVGGGGEGGGGITSSPITPPAIPSRSFLSPETEFRTEFYEVFISKREEKGLVRELARRMFEVDIGQFGDDDDDDDSEEDSEEEESSAGDQDEKEVDCFGLSVFLSFFFFFIFFLSLFFLALYFSFTYIPCYIYF
jgi:hypothetical protein